jgi:hypothetical protein
MLSAPLCLIQSTLKSSPWLSLLLAGTYELTEVESVASIPVQPVNLTTDTS